MPGGNFAVDGVDAMISGLRRDYPFLTLSWAQRLIRAYGTDAHLILGDARTANDLGQDFGATLTEAEIDWLMTREFARTSEDILWRRSKLGLRMSADAVTTLDKYLTDARSPRVVAAQRQRGEARGT